MAFSKRAPPEDRRAAGRRCTWSPSAGDDDGSATGTDHKVDRGELLGPSGAARLEKWRENMREKTSNGEEYDEYMMNMVILR